MVWGTSFGGGHAIASAATDHSVAAAIAQCPFTDGLASVRQIAPRESARLILAGVKDRLAQLAGRKPLRVKVAARPGELGLMNDAEAVDTVIALLEASGLTEADYRNEVPARIVLEIAFDVPGRRRSARLSPHPRADRRRELSKSRQAEAAAHPVGASLSLGMESAGAPCLATRDCRYAAEARCIQSAS